MSELIPLADKAIADALNRWVAKVRDASGREPNRAEMRAALRYAHEVTEKTQLDDRGPMLQGRFLWPTDDEPAEAELARLLEQEFARASRNGASPQTHTIVECMCHRLGKKVEELQNEAGL